MSQRKSAFSDILSKNKQPSNGEPNETATRTRPRAPGKINKATSQDYVKLTAYIPRDLHMDLKRAMLDEGTNDQSDYIETLIRKMLEQSHSATVSTHSRATG